MRLVLALALVASLAGCATADQMIRDATTAAAGTAAAGGMVTTTAASWSTTANEFRGRSGTFAFDCPSDPSQENAGNSIYGSGPYTDDSSVCTAGVHAGMITYERGGRVVIQPRPGQNRYAGSERNGVRTSDYSSYGGSFVVVR